jgi:hypothetical protein
LSIRLRALETEETVCRSIDKRFTQLGECYQSTLHLRRVSRITSPDAGLEFVETSDFALSESRPLVTLPLPEGSKKGRMSVDGAPNSKAPSNG